MINVSRALTDARLSQTFVIERYTGVRNPDGSFTKSSPTLLDRVGVIAPADALDQANFLAEGVRSDQMIEVYCTEDILMDDGSSQLADFIQYHGGRYKIIKAQNFSDYGYWYAMGDKQ